MRETRTKKGGEAGYRSLGLMHAKHALYHLSYIPELVQTVKFDDKLLVVGDKKLG